MRSRWLPGAQGYATHKEPSRQGNALSIGDNPQRLEIGGGWVCLVGQTSRELPWYEVPQTTCARGVDAFEFSVQCERNRPRDHTQIRLRDAQGRFVDYIEVGCELK